LPPGPRYDHHNRVSIKDWLGHPSLRVYKARWAAAVQVNHLNVAPLK
jgi:hypothetical protein